MTPKEKGKELIEKYRQHAYPPGLENYDNGYYDSETRIAKACAMIAVDEILNMEVWDWPHNTPEGKSFYLEVKEEIQKL